MNKPKRIVSSSALILSILFTNIGYLKITYADEPHPDKKERIHPKLVCFSVYCIFNRKLKEQKGFEKCRVSSIFTKFVSPLGEELLDDSNESFHPSLEIQCDNNLVYGSSAVRFTDWNGTRIQATPGPFPAITLPRAALRETHSYNYSFLQFEEQTLSGQCFVSTKPAPHD